MNHNSHNSFNLPNQRQQATGSKRQNDIPFLQLYKKLCNSISQQKIQELQEQLKKINDELFITFQKMENLVKKRQDKIKAQNQKLKQAIISMTGNLETNMNEILMETMEESEQNLENWNLLKQKKANYEKMHQNLLEMKRKTLGFGLFKKASK